MCPCICPVIDHRGRQNVGSKNIIDTLGYRLVRVPLVCFYHILTSSVIYYWADARQHGIYLFSIICKELNFVRIKAALFLARRGKVGPSPF